LIYDHVGLISDRAGLISDRILKSSSK
jgi:hypothetical protein